MHEGENFVNRPIDLAGKNYPWDDSDRYRKSDLRSTERALNKTRRRSKDRKAPSDYQLTEGDFETFFDALERRADPEDPDLAIRVASRMIVDRNWAISRSGAILRNFLDYAAERSIINHIRTDGELRRTGKQTTGTEDLVASYHSIRIRELQQIQTDLALTAAPTPPALRR